MMGVVKINLVQVHRGELAMASLAVAREMVEHAQLNMDTMLHHIAESLDREMYQTTGHLDAGRVWFVDGFIHTPSYAVTILDGPHAGRVVHAPAMSDVRIPGANGCVSVYDVHRYGAVRFGVFRRRWVSHIYGAPIGGFNG
jgi:hypothetical protein